MQALMAVERAPLTASESGHPGKDAVTAHLRTSHDNAVFIAPEVLPRGERRRPKGHRHVDLANPVGSAPSWARAESLDADVYSCERTDVTDRAGNHHADPSVARAASC